ncbi:MAG: 23S rRNA (pseudouridine(1915)-N(3))-methyltransferase RlmH [Hyphomicrobiales bacterium]|nr:23S rRNA (pseudouridine(1915)-N(3))-methyltransferase RlmH [Hyphomicrobiales bacterium]MBV8825662.1 23S rRNA (pseudouridine(1915)-N(3))-methyltransferase RlmH [Hyphomicrobiales bacterium]MBV9427498.1 23S rRNA (pseudouridine(1915)-N(3))-methyltransferase RlmH [Bradyrhizobiaceae bacterium]
MRLVVAAVGRLKRGPERDLAERYGERAAKAGRAIGIRAVTINEIDESRARRTADRVAEEAAALKTLIPPQAAVIALDERGETLTSEVLAQRIGRWRDQGRPDLVILIGGPDGLAPQLLATADLRLAFGHMTWPHQLVRIMAFEQLYRAIAILSGHPYHRA